MKFRYIYFFCLLLSFSLVSCKKLLDKEPTDKLSIEDTFKDIDGAKSALAGAYHGLLSTQIFNCNVMVYPELIGGNLKYFKLNNLILDDVYNGIQNAADCSMNDSYKTLYDQLNNVNNIIYYTPTSSGEIGKKDRIIADAKCIRALIHFRLLQYYSRFNNLSSNGIIINYKPLLYSDPLPKRVSVEESFNFIREDLKSAIAAYPSAGSVFTGGYSANYFNEYVAKALLSKVDLFSQNWQEAYNLADDVIKNSGKTLLTNSQYVSSWNGRIPSSESVFELAIESNFSGNSLGTYFDAAESFYGMFAASNDLLNLFSSTDIRNKNSMYSNSVINGNSYFLTKKYAKGSLNATPVKLLRLSEVYLIRAEAAAMQNNFIQANADLNTIRQRADPSAVSFNINVQADLIDAILLERRKELAFEGNLLSDLIRKAKGVTRTDGNSKTPNLAADDYRMLLPIPQQSILNNPKSEQNPGY